MAGECMLYVYRTSLVRDDHALLITSVGGCALYLSTLLSEIVSQICLGWNDGPKNPQTIEILFYVSIGFIVLAGIWAFLYFPGEEMSLAKTRNSGELTVKDIFDRITEESKLYCQERTALQIGTVLQGSKLKPTTSTIPEATECGNMPYSQSHAFSTYRKQGILLVHTLGWVNGGTI